jgi:hypothetical protein
MIALGVGRNDAVGIRCRVGRVKIEVERLALKTLGCICEKTTR